MIAAFRSVHQPVRAVMPLRFKVSPLLSYRTASEIVGVPRVRVFTSNSKVGSRCVPVTGYQASIPLLKLLQGGIRRASGQPDSEHPDSPKSDTNTKGLTIDAFGPNMKIPVAEMVWSQYTKWFRRALFFKILLAISFAMAIPIFALWLYEKGRMWSIKHAVLASHTNSVLPRNNIQRPDTIKKIYNIMDFQSGGVFFVMIGPHGIGKSTLVRQFAAENPGVIYINVPNANSNEEIAKKFIFLFAQKISWRPAVPSFVDYIARKLFGAPKPETEPLDAMFQDFSVVAKQYLEKHGRPVVLIIDEINLLARFHPSFLRGLLQFAKISADEGYFNVVFVCSDGIIPTNLKEYTGSSRADVVTIGDFTRSEALEYLMTKTSLGIDKPTAEKIADFTGNRIIDMIKVLKNMRKGRSLEDIFEGMKKEAWETCVLKENDASKSTLQQISKKLLKEESITESEFYKLCGNDSVGQSFINRNIFTIVPKSQDTTTITFGSKVMQTSIKENLGI